MPWVFSFRRALHLDKIHLPGRLSGRDFLVCLIVPGFALSALGRRTIGLGFQLVYWLAIPVFVIALGYPVANVAYGLMIGIHATGLVYLLSVWLGEDARFGLRVVLAVVAVMVLWQLVYSPMVGFAERHWCLPLRVHGQVVVVNPRARSQPVKGGWMMYSLAGGRDGDAHEGGVIVVRGGYGWGPVLAAAGDQVSFSTNGFAINGVTQSSLSNMPMGGEFVVPEKHWFVWPEFAMGGRGNANPQIFSDRMIQLGMVSEAQVIGRPYKHWFFRHQTF